MTGVDLTRGGDGTFRREVAATSPGATALPVTAELVRVLIRQNEDALRGLRRAPPRDAASPDGRQHAMTIADLADQTELLRERLVLLLENPPRRRRRSWLDIPPTGSAP